MQAIKLLILLTLGIAVILIGVLFSIHNTTRVSIDLIWLKLPEASLSLWLVAAFVLGALVGTLFSSLRNLILLARLKNMGRKARSSERQLQKLREEQRSH